MLNASAFVDDANAANIFCPPYHVELSNNIWPAISKHNIEEVNSPRQHPASWPAFLSSKESVLGCKYK